MSDPAASTSSPLENALLRAVIDSLPQEIVVLDGRGEVIAINAAWARFAFAQTGAPDGFSLGANYLDVCRAATRQGDADARAVLDGLEALLSGDRREFCTEYPCHGPDGERWFLMHAARVDEALGAVMLSHTEISSQKQAEAALRESEERFRALAEMSPDAILVNLEGSYVYANPAAARVLGARDAGEIIGLGPERIVAPEFQALVAERLRRTLEQGRAEPYVEYLWRKLDGALVDVQVGTAPISWMGRKAIQVVGRDISARKRAETALRDAHRRKDEFLATLAHELRNPLAPISNAAHALRRANVGDPESAARQDALLAMLERNVDHLVRLVDDLMEVSRMTRGKIELRKERVDLRRILRNAVEINRAVLDARKHRLTLELPDAPTPLDADPVRLTQVFANLLNNAAKYTPEGGDVRLRVERRDGQAIVALRDDGVGIPAERLDCVFELFSQIAEHRALAGGGLGIGLALARDLVALHGGAIKARSEGPGKGSEFVVTLPLAEDRRAMEDAAENPAMTLLESARRVMVVDDDRDVANSLVMLLETYGVEARAVYDGARALDAIAAFEPHLVLLDLGMPGLGGCEIVRRLRAESKGAGPRLVALTGWGQESDRQRTREAGFDLHLTKPVSLTALEALLRSLGECGNAAAQAPE